MDITRTAIANERTTSVLLAVVLVAGLVAYFNMPRAEDPGFTVRTAQIITEFPGASPERVETLISDKLEEAIQEIPELDYVTSESKTGVSVIYVNIEESYTEMRPIWDDLRRKIDAAREELPEGALAPVVNDDFGDVFGIVIGLVGEGYSYAELEEVAEEVRDEMLLNEEVAKVEIHGAQEERIFVEFNNARLADLGVSPMQLERTLAATNILIPGGEVNIGTERLVIEPSGNFETLDELRRTVLQIPGLQEVVYLEDITDVRRGYIDPPESRARINGHPGLALAVSMREDGNISQLGEQVTATVERMQSQYPIGLEMQTVAFQPDEVNRKVGNFAASLVQSVLIVIAVMLLTLGVRTGLVVASLIPMAMLLSLASMYFVFDIGLDQMSIAALIIALGLLVDNSIVMTESILVRMDDGEGRLEAALGSAKELRVPLLTASLTTAAAFLPIFLADSSTGEYTAPLFKVVTITLLASWLLALTMIPLLSTYVLRVDEDDAAPTAAGDDGDRDRYESRFYGAYRGFLGFCLKNRLVTLSAVAVLFGGSIGLSSLLPTIFFPPSDRAFFSVDLELPRGTALEETEAVVQSVETYIDEKLRASPDEFRAERYEVDGITTWATFIGEGAPRFALNYTPEESAPEHAYLMVNTSSFEAVEPTMEKLRSYLRELDPDLDFRVRPTFNGPPVEKPVQVRISGSKFDEIFAIADSVESRLKSLEGTGSVTDDWGRRTKKLFVDIDPERARRAGVTNQDIAVSLLTVFSGYQTTEFREEEDTIPIALRSVAADRQDIGKLETLNVYSQATGESVPLKQVADVELRWQYPNILRRNKLRTVTVACDLQDGYTAAGVVEQLRPWLERQDDSWPRGSRWEIGGEVETSIEANASIGEKVPIAALIILFLLVAQFNSLRRPVIILSTIPLGVIGVFAGLYAAGSYFGFMTLLGIIALSGIVINNAIVLIDRIDLEREDLGRQPAEEVVRPAQRRLRPILLTAATTMGGLLPLWLMGGAMWEPLAISIIFGVAFATLLTLGVVPVLYSLLFDVSFKQYRYGSDSGE